ncbi:solute carrier family 12 member 9-like isoform X1 [Mytilus galloprovincialis]|uniref:solute carrier family 12 member 9-like isoform X1 n=2 Tax=Mytilus galloprovincialis TaxID=29158 RepID=UPI003F7B625C
MTALPSTPMQRMNSSTTGSFNEVDDEHSPLVSGQSSPRTRLVWQMSQSNAYLIPDANDGNPARPRSSNRTLGTFAGVFCPVALSMFSTLLFLRAGFVVGQAGILEIMLQLVLAYFILMMTVLSICAISTNGAVEGGGAYYMISRALGPEFGGSIGFLFFVANILACGLYVTGFVEAVLDSFGPKGSMISDGGAYLPLDGKEWYKYLYSSVVLFFCLAICMIGGSMFAKTLIVIFMITVVCTLSVYISIFAKSERKLIQNPRIDMLDKRNESCANHTFYTGLSGTTFKDNFYEQYGRDYITHDKMDFATVFSILFSSVTGILNGANMSGELKDPSKAIPKGTLSAVTFTFGTYFILMVLVGASCDRCLLLNDYLFLQSINLWSPFILIGIFAATLSAALGNLIGASRILQALANDELFWFVLRPATKVTRGGNPYIAVLISWFLVQIVLLVGSLNAIAPAASVFFLLSYASVNLACLALELASAPNFRPTFNIFTWHTCVLGIIGSMVMCFLVSAMYSSIAIIIMLLLVILLHFKSVPSEWGSISQALIFHQVRKYLLMLDPRKAHIKYWRPQILLMVAHPRQACELIHFINDIKKGGLFIIGHVKIGSLDKFDYDPVQTEYPQWMSLIDKLKVKAFAELTLANTVSDGLAHLIRLSGLGGMKPNTVCLGFYDDSKPVDSLVKCMRRKRRFFSSEEINSSNDVDMMFDNLPIRSERSHKHQSPSDYVKMIYDSLKLQKNVCICRHFNLLDKSIILKSTTEYYIDVWPLNLFRPYTASIFDDTCLFMLQLACILDMVPGWKSKTYLRVMLCTNNEGVAGKNVETKLDKVLKTFRIPAKIQPISLDLGESYKDLSEDEDHQMTLYKSIPEHIVQKINTRIKECSKKTAVTFMYLPRPPQDTTGQLEYLLSLTALTNDLPPTVLVHGLNPVISTTL